MPRKAQYGLTNAHFERMYREEHPEVIIHLAAVVGGIGANRATPGMFAYENLILWAMLIEYARLKNVKKFVTVGTICSYPMSNGQPRRCLDTRRAGLGFGFRAQKDFCAASVKRSHGTERTEGSSSADLNP